MPSFTTLKGLSVGAERSREFRRRGHVLRARPLDCLARRHRRDKAVPRGPRREGRLAIAYVVLIEIFLKTVVRSRLLKSEPRAPDTRARAQAFSRKKTQRLLESTGVAPAATGLD